ncbi:hypothetical protein Ancab_000074 [Ancistrocladus abbreviatus]
MGRGRGKGKKLSPNHEDPGSGEEEKIPAQKRRGRPQKPPKDEIDDEEVEKLEEDDNENNSGNLSSKETTVVAAAENGKKRKRSLQAKEKPSPIKDENGVGAKSSTDDSIKSNGVRHIGSRRRKKHSSSSSEQVLGASESTSEIFCLFFFMCWIGRLCIRRTFFLSFLLVSSTCFSRLPLLFPFLIC